LGSSTATSGVNSSGGEILASGTPRQVFVDQGHERLRTFLSRLDSAHAFGEHR
jgi:hypothetical protein